jgi:hypothetical protein
MFRHILNCCAAIFDSLKDEIMGVLMSLDVDQAAKFWPIYSEYDAQLTKLNNLSLANIQNYARNYDQMTSAKADELVQNVFNIGNSVMNFCRPCNRCSELRECIHACRAGHGEELSEVRHRKDYSVEI